MLSIPAKRCDREVRLASNAVHTQMVRRQASGTTHTHTHKHYPLLRTKLSADKPDQGGRNIEFDLGVDARGRSHDDEASGGVGAKLSARHRNVLLNDDLWRIFESAELYTSDSIHTHTHTQNTHTKHTHKTHTQSTHT